jgi:hypothetical protein
MLFVHVRIACIRGGLQRQRSGRPLVLDRMRRRDDSGGCTSFELRDSRVQDARGDVHDDAQRREVHAGRRYADGRDRAAESRDDLLHALTASPGAPDVRFAGKMRWERATEVRHGKAALER